jgi:zinc transport system ATP-binding protein
MSEDNNILISIKDLSYTYPDTGNEVLTNINIDIPKGIILGLIGPNGGGKTTLLKIMLGLIKGYKGEVKVRCSVGHDDKNIHHTCVGYVPQKSYINRKFPATVYDTIEMGLYGYTGFGGITSVEKDYIDWLLKEVGIVEIKNSSVNKISGGQLQRTLIARALVTKPSLLFLDEPLGGIDQTGIMMFVELLLSLKQRLNLTVVFVSHDFMALTMCSDRIACLNRVLHYHDNPEHLTAEELSRIYSCSYEAYQNVDQIMRYHKDFEND